MPLEENTVKYLGAQLAQGLKYLWENRVVHRDIKPQNLLLTGGTNSILKIADFGFAGPVEGRDGQGYLHTKLGTLNYMAPEILLETGYTADCDWWSLGVVLYQLIAGQMPFDGDTQEELFHKI